jgi:hypothetical protein
VSGPVLSFIRDKNFGLSRLGRLALDLARFHYNFPAQSGVALAKRVTLSRVLGPPGVLKRKDLGKQKLGATFKIGERTLMSIGSRSSQPRGVGSAKL